MQFQLPIQIHAPRHKITYRSKIALFGSCFTENIYHYLQRACFNAAYNSHGIVFNPISVSRAIDDCIENRKYTEKGLFYLNELYASWYHHSDFSAMGSDEALVKINAAISFFHDYLKSADTVVITLGSAFAYNLLAQNIYVSNNHRAPSQWFEKHLLTHEQIRAALDHIIQKILAFGELTKKQIIFTISPVRHIRDGVVDNNRSKARLIEVVHSLCENYEAVYYFPAYELVVDVLRDYRFYDIDMVHPNFAATQFVWEKFSENCIDDSALEVMPEFEALSTAYKHKPFQPDTEAHKQFLARHLQKTAQLQQRFPDLDLERFIRYFGTIPE